MILYGSFSLDFSSLLAQSSIGSTSEVYSNAMSFVIHSHKHDIMSNPCNKSMKDAFVFLIKEKMKVCLSSSR